jgi:hypothetical protein
MKIEDLKLRNIEVLDSVSLRIASSGSSGSVIDGGSLGEVEVWGSAGSGSGSAGSSGGGAMGSHFASWYYGSESSSGSGSGYGSNYGSGGSGSGWPWCKDECDKNSDCGTDQVCDKKDCDYPLKMFTHKVCRDMTSRERNCVGKSLCQRCTYLSDRGTWVDGQCSQAIGAPTRYCTYQCYS